MRIYVAAKLEEKEKVRALYALLRSKGHEITLDWTQEPGLPGLTSIEQHQLLEEWGIKEIEAVANCDLLIQLPHPLSRGAYAELGMAVITGKPCLIVVPEEYIHCIFFHVPKVRYISREIASDAESLDLVVRAMAGSGRLITFMSTPYGPDRPALLQVIPAGRKELPDTPWTRELTAKAVAFKERLKEITAETSADNKLIKKLPLGCGKHYVSVDLEALEDLEALHGAPGVVELANTYKDCRTCG